MSGRKNGQFGLEALENRRLLSAASPPLNTPPGDLPVPLTINAHVTSRGTLVIDGTNFGDVIGVKLGRGTVVVTSRSGNVPGSTLTFDGGQVKRILVEAGEGSDRVGIASDIGRACTLAGGGGNDTLVGSAGDTLIGGHGNDKLVAQTVLQSQAVLLTNSATNRPTSTLLESPPGPPSLLSGGEGKDVLVAGDQDIVVGGRGVDLATYHSRTPLASGTDPHAFGRDAFGTRAIGVENFDAFPQVPTITIQKRSS
jgi:Ca2+-binding RTX toxin-like protein